MTESRYDPDILLDTYDGIRASGYYRKLAGLMRLVFEMGPHPLPGFTPAQIEERRNAFIVQASTRRLLAEVKRD